MTTDFENRLATLEKDVAQLKSERTGRHPVVALEKIHGTFKNDKAFQEAMSLGRKWRKSLDTQPRRKSKAKRR
jgi:hypothetical protein